MLQVFLTILTFGTHREVTRSHDFSMKRMFGAKNWSRKKKIFATFNFFPPFAEENALSLDIMF